MLLATKLRNFYSFTTGVELYQMVATPKHTTEVKRRERTRLSIAAHRFKVAPAAAAVAVAVARV